MPLLPELEQAHSSIVVCVASCLIGAVTCVLRDYRSAKSTLFLLASIALGAVAVACPVWLGSSLLAVSGVLAWLGFRSQKEVGKGDEAVSLKVERIVWLLILSTLAFFIFYRLGTYSTHALTWEGSVVNGLANKFNSGISLVDLFRQQLQWQTGTLSSGDDTLLFGVPALAITQYFWPSLTLLRAISAIYFLASVVIFGLFLRRWFGRTAGVIGLVTLGLNLAALFYARYASSVAGALCALMLALAICCYLVKKLSYFAAVLAPIALFLATLGYAPARMPVVVLTVCSIVGIFVVKGFRISRRILVGAIFIAGVCLTIYFEDLHGRLSVFSDGRGEQFFAMVQGGDFPEPVNKLNVFSGGPRSALTPGEKIGIGIELARQVTGGQLLGQLIPFSEERYVDPAWYFFDSDPPFMKLISPVLWPFLVIGVIRLFSAREWWLNSVLWGWLLVSSAGLLLTNRADTHRALFLVVPLCIWCVVGITEFLKIFVRLGFGRAIVPLAALLLVVGGVLPRWKQLYAAPSSPPPHIEALGSVIKQVEGPLLVLGAYPHHELTPIWLALMTRRQMSGSVSEWVQDDAGNRLSDNRVFANAAYVKKLASRIAAGTPLLMGPSNKFKDLVDLLSQHDLQILSIKRPGGDFFLARAPQSSAANQLGERVFIAKPVAIPAVHTAAPTTYTPVPETFPGASTVSLASLTPISVSAGFSGPRMGTGWQGEELSVSGKTYDSGIGIHAPTRMRFLIPNEAVSFKTLVGLDDDVQACEQVGSVVMRIADESGKILYESGVLDKGRPSAFVAIGIRGSKELILDILEGDDGIDCDHVVLGDPLFVVQAIGATTK